VIAISLGVGFVSAIISTILRNIPHLLNRTSFDFWSMLPIVFSLICFFVVMIFKKRMKKRNEKLYEDVFVFILMVYSISSCFYYLPVVFMQLKNFVYYGESAVSTIVLFRVIGYMLGILMIFLSALAVYKIAAKLENHQFLMIFIGALLIRGVSQFNVIVQRLYFLKIIPKRSWIFSVIAWIANNENYFIFIFMALLVIMPVILWKKNIYIVQEYKNKAELRKIKYLMKNKRHWAQFFLVLIFINIFSLSALKIYAEREIPLSSPEDYTIEDGRIVIPLDSLEDELLHRYAYKSQNGINMRFIIIKKSIGSYGVGLDACEICGPSGYFMRSNEVVCKLCDVVMNKGTIGFKGGCNPIPFPYVVHDKKIKIDPRTLDELDYVFK